ncbi:ead/Ea22-like family protein [Citrobacter koseri]|nr:ead/Ea22-like family protein [Citrobacter koseri]
MSNIDKQALREAANAANIASWGRWESYKPHKGARGYEVKVGVKAIAQHCLKVDSAFIAAANPATVLALLDELEAAQSYAKERDEENQDLMLTVGRLRVEKEAAEKRIAELREWNAGLAQESFERQQRIAELEERTPTVKMPEPFKLAKSSSGLTYYYADEVDKALAAASINVEAE